MKQDKVVDVKVNGAGKAGDLLVRQIGGEGRVGLPGVGEKPGGRGRGVGRGEGGRKKEMELETAKS